MSRNALDQRADPDPDGGEIVGGAVHAQERAGHPAADERARRQDRERLGEVEDRESGAPAAQAVQSLGVGGQWEGQGAMRRVRPDPQAVARSGSLRGGQGMSAGDQHLVDDVDHAI